MVKIALQVVSGDNNSKNGINQRCFIFYSDFDRLCKNKLFATGVK
jgi:hypothetical protein